MVLELLASCVCSKFEFVLFVRLATTVNCSRLLFAHFSEEFSYPALQVFHLYIARLMSARILSKFGAG